MKNIGVVIYTHNRVDDAKINIEIIRNLWEASGLFNNVKIVHSFNGEKSWYPKKYLENDLVVLKNSWHFQGAADLIDAGLKKMSLYKNIDYVIVLAADTWLINPGYLNKLLTQMKGDEFRLATCAWGLLEQNLIQKTGVATDFFILDLKWAKKYKLFPINYGEFYKKYKDLFLYQNGGAPMLEKLFLSKFIKAISLQEKFDVFSRKEVLKKILVMKERTPIHLEIDNKDNWVRKMYWPKMGLLTHHDPGPKKQILKRIGIKKGENIKKLLNSTDLLYFNKGTRKTNWN